MPDYYSNPDLATVGGDYTIPDNGELVRLRQMRAQLFAVVDQYRTYIGANPLFAQFHSEVEDILEQPPART